MRSFLKNLREIYDGWKNDAFPTDDVLTMSEQRARICASCPLNINGTCSPEVQGEAVITFEYREELRHQGKLYKGCNCPLSKKTKSPKSKCPLGKW